MPTDSDEEVISPDPDPEAAFTTPVVFTWDELWFLHHFVRHEIAQQRNWTNPPADKDLNDQICEKLLLCYEQKMQEAALILTYSDCLAIDGAIDDSVSMKEDDGKTPKITTANWMKDADKERRPLVVGGISVTLKCSAARRQLRNRIPDLLPEGAVKTDQKNAGAEARERIEHAKLYGIPESEQGPDA